MTICSDTVSYSVLKSLVFGYCDHSVRGKDWRCCKRGTQATLARQGDLAGVTHVRQRQSFERMYTLLWLKRRP